MRGGAAGCAAPPLHPTGQQPALTCPEWLPSVDTKLTLNRRTGLGGASQDTRAESCVTSEKLRCLGAARGAVDTAKPQGPATTPRCTGTSGRRPGRRALTGPDADAPGLAGLRPLQAAHPDVVVPAGLQASQQHLRLLHPAPVWAAFTWPPPAVPHPSASPQPPPHLPPPTSLASSSPLGVADAHRTRYWAAPAEGCQVRRMVLGVTAARASAWGGGRGAGRGGTTGRGHATGPGTQGPAANSECPHTSPCAKPPAHGSGDTRPPCGLLLGVGGPWWPGGCPGLGVQGELRGSGLLC